MNPFLDHDLYHELVRLLGDASSGSLEEIGRRLSDAACTHPPNIVRECLEEILDRQAGAVRVMASAWSIASHPGTPLAARAVSALTADLTNEAAEVRRCALFYLFYTNSTPTTAIPLIAPLLTTPEDEQVNLWAAAAIYQIPVVSDEFRDVARMAGIQVAKTFAGEELAPFLVAAIAMGRQGVDRERVAAAVVRRFRLGTEEEKLAALIALPKIGVFDDEIEQMLEGLVFTPYDSRQIRVQAVHALADMPAGHAGVDSLLYAALHIFDWEVSRHAYAVLLSRESYTRDLVAALVALGASNNGEKRLFGALGLADVGSEAAWTAPILISRLESEADESVCSAMIDALGAIGVPAIGPLVEAVRRGSLRTLPLYQYALLAIGDAGVLEFARLIGDPDSRIRELAGYLLQSLGPKAATAAPMLGGYITSENREACKYALIAVTRIGAAGRELARAAAGRLLDDDEELAWWAETALVGIGNDSIPHVERLLGSLADVHGRCGSVLARLRAIGAAPAPPAANGVEGVTNEKHLKLFAVAGRLAADEGIDALRAVARRIEELQCMNAAPLELAASEGTLRIAFGELEQKLSASRGRDVKLFARKERLKRGGMTPEGVAFLAKVERHLNFRLRLDAGENA